MRGLTQAQINQTLCDQRTALPPDLTLPRVQTGADLLGLGQLVTQADQAEHPGDEPDPYAILGVSPSASIQEIRGAWLKLVKELHPNVDEPLVSERLKSINQAYQRLKQLERQGTQREAGRGAARFNPWVVFALFFVLSTIAGILGTGAWVYLMRTDAVLGDASTHDSNSATQIKPEPPGIPARGPNQSPAEEPTAAADGRLR